MATQTEAQIFLAEQRGRSETDFVRSYHTFNFGAYQIESRKPFGSLSLLNDDTLTPGSSLTMQVEQPTDVILLPIVGGLEYSCFSTTGTSGADFLEPGQMGILSLATGTTYTISNPYEIEAINHLQIWFVRPPGKFTPAVHHVYFELSTKNSLMPLLEGVNTAKDTGNRLLIGQYGGREEGTYPVEVAAEMKSRKLFVFVLQGVFEVANRLLHEKDGLSLDYKHSDVLEFEALSNEAILLLIELQTF